LSQNLDTLFSGKFYIDQSYGLGLVPSLISIFTGKTMIEKSEVDKIKGITKVMMNVNSSSADVSSALSGTEKKVVVLDFKQPVVKFSTYDWLGTQAYISILETLKIDPAVVGVLIDTDSGGGQVYGTPEFYDVIKSFAEVKTIGFYTNGYMCSGAYYFAAGGTFIMANKRADAIGSIGGYSTMINYNGMLEKYGAKVHTLYSDLSPDKNKEHRGVMDGTDEGGKEYIKIELNPMVLTFHADMKSARPQLNEEVFKGGTWTGDQALEMGLIDFNGSLQDAVNKVFELSNTGNSNNNINQNKKKSMSNTKSFPVLQGIIGIEGEGIATVSTITGKKGVQITEAQLEKLESNLAAQEAALTAANTKVTTAESRVSTLETTINTAVTTAGLDATVEAAATTETKITLLGAKVVEYGNKSGAKVTTPKAEGDSFEDDDNLVNAADAHNEFYNKA
jgi:ClpP class serine protease